MLRNLFSLPRRLTSRPRRRQATRRRALADRLPWIEPLEGRLLLAVNVSTTQMRLSGLTKRPIQQQLERPVQLVKRCPECRRHCAVHRRSTNSDRGSIDNIPFTGSMEVDESGTARSTSVCPA